MVTKKPPIADATPTSKPVDMRIVPAEEPESDCPVMTLDAFDLDRGRQPFPRLAKPAEK
jgi:hypothetical protein